MKWTSAAVKGTWSGAAAGAAAGVTAGGGGAARAPPHAASAVTPIKRHPERLMG
jgi:hypothetical protein